MQYVNKRGYKTNRPPKAAKAPAKEAKAMDINLASNALPMSALPANGKGLKAIQKRKLAAIDAAPQAAAAPKAPPAPKPLSARAKIEADAAAGILPPAPDFERAETHKPYRKKLADLIALIEAGDIAALEAFKINPTSSSPIALNKYRNLAVIALKSLKAQKAT